MKKAFETANAPAPIGPYSQVVVSNGTAFLSGQVAINPANGVMITESLEAETHQVMKNIGAVLAELGVDYNAVIKSSIFLIDMNDFAAVNEIYGSYFEQPFPARECVQVCRLPKDAKVEISIIAEVPG